MPSLTPRLACDLFLSLPRFPSFSFLQLQARRWHSNLAPSSRMDVPLLDRLIYLCASWVGTILYTVELGLAGYYFYRFSSRPRLRFLVAGILLMDSVGMLAFFAQTWMILSDATSQQPSLFVHSCTRPILVCTTAVSAIIEQVFLINRYKRLSQNCIICMPLVLLVILHAGFSFFSGFYVFFRPDDSPGPGIVGMLTTTISACLATAVDVLIPVALVWQLHAIGPVCLERSYGRRLINAISAGCLGGVLSIILIILFWTQRNVYAGAVFPLGGVHCITVLVNLVVCKRRSTMVGFPPAPKSPELDVEIVLESAPGKRSISPRIVDTFVSRQAFFVDVERKSTQDTKIGYGESLEGTFSPVAL